LYWFTEGTVLYGAATLLLRTPKIIRFLFFSCDWDVLPLGVVTVRKVCERRLTEARLTSTYTKPALLVLGALEIDLKAVLLLVPNPVSDGM
jgi:hypothetical protein